MKKEGISSYMITGTEWFARLAMLNLVWFLFSLPIITAIPAFYAMFHVLKEWVEGNTKIPVFSTFKKAFTHYFGKSYKMGAPFVIVGLVISVNLFFFLTQSNPSNWFYILKYANYLLAVLYVLLMFYYFSLNQLAEFKMLKMIALSFVVAASQPVYTLSLVVLAILLFLFFNFFPGFLFFFSTSVLGLAFMKAAQKGYKRLLEKAGNKQGD